MMTDPSIKSRLFACIVAATIGLTTANTTLAGDCGCKAACDTCPAVVSTCSCDCSHSKKPSCLHKALDAITSGFKKMCSFGKRGGGCDQLCDDACDAAMIDELMLPTPAAVHHHPHHAYSEPVQIDSAPIHVHPLHEHPLHEHPLHDHEHDTELHMTEPRIQPLQDEHTSADGESGIVPPPVRMSVPEPDNDRESLFDTLSDPFNDDEVRRRTYRSVRPTSYDEYGLRPISKRPLSRNYSTSSRRAASVR